MHGIGCPIAFQLAVVERLNRVMAVRRSHRSIFSLKSWLFTPATTSETYVGAASFNNPDHVDIVIHDYRWRLGLADGERKYDDREKRLAALPAVTVPAITMEGDSNGAIHAPPAAYRGKFSGKYEHRVLTGGIGHNLPQE